MALSLAWAKISRAFHEGYPPLRLSEYPSRPASIGPCTHVHPLVEICPTLYGSGELNLFASAPCAS